MNGRPVTPSPGIADPPGSAPDPWTRLRASTRARIGLGRVGDAMPLAAVLELQAAHAAARDAVHAPLDTEGLAAAIREATGGPVAIVRSRAPDRATYLRRPDLGRELSPEDAALLAPGACDLALVVADGLSAVAARRHAPAVIAALCPLLPDVRLAPVVIAREARVAIGDGIGAALGARHVAVLIGERPGLTVADSLGIYLTRAPRPGRRDSERNCISNIHRAGGLAPAEAAARLAWLLREADRIGATGIALKDGFDPRAAIEGGGLE